MFSGGRKMRVSLHPDIDADELTRGAEVVLNESLNVVLARAPERTGEVVTFKELLDDGHRAMIVGRADEERVVELSDDLDGVKLRAGDSVLLDPRAALLLEKLPRPEVEELVLEEVPDISYDDVGGLDDQIEPSWTPSSCRSCTRTCSASTSCRPPRASCSTARPAAARR